MTEFYLDRTSGIGGSDVAGIFSIKPYGCCRKVWLEKKKQEPDYEPQDNFNLRRGTLFEEVAANLYEKETGRNVRKPNRGFRSREFPFMIGHIDRLIIDPKQGTAPMEIKNPGVSNFMKIKREGIPDEYVLQLNHYMIVKGADWGTVCVFSPEMADIIHKDYEKNSVLVKEIVRGEKEFWDSLATNEIPPVLGVEDKRCGRCKFKTFCYGDIAELLGKEGEFEYEPSWDVMIEEYLNLKQEFEDVEERLDWYKGEIKSLMGDRQKVRTDLVKIYHAVQEARRFDVKAFEKDYPDLAKQYKKVSVSRPFRIFMLNEKVKSG